jgi:hypothetical protein
VPEECPATTTCPIACAANVTDCPTQCAPGLTLCHTGNCEVDCTVHNEMYSNPCECGDLPVACPKVVDLYPVCKDRFQSYYDANAACMEAQVEAVTKVSFWGPWFLAFYIGFIIIFLLVTLWCWLNEVVFSVPSSTQAFVVTNGASKETWTQTGYRTSWIGTIIYILVELSFIVIQVLLLATTIFYYMQQGAITRFPLVFEDEIQVLLAFQLVWMFGFVWCFWFRYPTTGLYSLFLRRCPLHRATHVAVVAPLQCSNGSGASAAQRMSQSRIGRIATIVWSRLIRSCASCFLTSTVNLAGRPRFAAFNTTRGQIRRAFCTACGAIPLTMRRACLFHMSLTRM